MENPRSIFVFGSNEAGRHGRGSARAAVLHHGAIPGQGEGIQGNAYGIPTKDKELRVLRLGQIRLYVNRFIEYAYKNKHLSFRVVEIGCGLAGYSPAQIAPMFAEAPSNVHLPASFQKIIYATQKP